MRRSHVPSLDKNDITPGKCKRLKLRRGRHVPEAYRCYKCMLQYTSTSVCHETLRATGLSVQSGCSLSAYLIQFPSSTADTSRAKNKQLVLRRNQSAFRPMVCALVRTRGPTPETTQPRTGSPTRDSCLWSLLLQGEHPDVARWCSRSTHCRPISAPQRSYNLPRPRQSPHSTAHVSTYGSVW